MNECTVTQIDARLAAIRAEHHVTIPLAIESGSRAWGFPSPDSDYDCRFIFVRPRADYLRLFPLRDVIETPLEADLDVNGWDLPKTLKLLLKGNAVVVEWLTSPIIYNGDDWFRRELLDIARRHIDRNLAAQHYLHLGLRQRHAYFEDGKHFRLKKLFYALRPAAALRWLRLHPEIAIAPMHFPTLISECQPPAEVTELVAELIIKKASTRELGEGEMPKSIATFIDGEFDEANKFFAPKIKSASPEAVSDAQKFFLDALDSVEFK